jgi:hypothetical protein
MSVSTRIETLEENLDTVASKITTQSERAQTSIDIQQASILEALEEAMKTLRTGSSRTIEFQESSVQSSTTSRLQQLTTQRQNRQLQKQIATDLTIPFKNVEKLADDMMQDLMRERIQALELEDEVDTLKVSLERVSTQAENDVNRAEGELEFNESEMTVLNDQLEDLEMEVRTLEGRRDDVRTGQAVLGTVFRLWTSLTPRCD